MTWLREMGGLMCEWWQIEKDYRWTMRELRKEVKRQGRAIHEARNAE